MCGFVAVIDRAARQVPLTVLRRMADTLSHRGPDGEGHLLDGPVGLYHKRLAIIDIEGGQQPMTDASGELHIVFNGEIYNHVELREELRAQGHVFRTRSDTEVLLHLYAAEGEAFLRRLNGMFAFVLYDRARRRVLVARDQFGIKPLYFHWRDDLVIYASEIKAILEHPEVEAIPDLAHLEDYVTFQHVLGRGTLFDSVHKVLPGQYQILSLDDGRLITRDYWRLDYTLDPTLDERRALEELRFLLHDACRLQVRSDVPVGAHLSGGIDSSLVASMAAPHCPSPFFAFHGCFDAGPLFDESEHAAAVAGHAGLELMRIPIGGRGFADLMPSLIRFMDEPVAGPGLYPQFCVSREAAQRVKVVLGGQGGDEMFCGYARYLVGYLEQAIKGAIYETNDEGEHIVSLLSILPNLPYLRQYVPMLRRFWSEGLFEDMDRRYFRLLDRSEGQLDVFSADFRARFDRDAVFSRFQAEFNSAGTASYISKMRNFDRIASLPALLHVEDRVSMAVSLESRVPLLDHRIAELLAKLPPRILFAGGHLKQVLRRLAGEVIPASVVQRKDKMGFPLPIDDWTRNEARDFVHDVLFSQRCVERGLFDIGAVRRLLQERNPFSRKLWGLLCLELWHREFIDADGRARHAGLETVEVARG